jgi:hypothetical protein
MNAITLALELIRGLILKLSCTSKNKELASDLTDRLNVLLGPISQLNSGCLHDSSCKSAIARLNKSIIDVSKLSERLMKRGAFGRFLHSGGDKESLRDIDRKLDSCVGDLNLMISISSNIRIQHGAQLHDFPQYFATEQSQYAESAGRGWEIAMVEPTLDTPRLALTNTRAACSDTALNWDVIWLHLSMELVEFQVDVSLALAYQLKKLFKVDANGFVERRRLNKGLSTIEDPRGLVKLLDEAQQFEAILENFDDGPACVAKLRLKVVKLPSKIPFDYALGSVITISYKGMRSSANFQANRVTRFGCPASMPDICFSPRDTSVAGDVFQIFSNSDGYYAIDSANSSIAQLRVRPNYPVVVKKGDVISFGADNCFCVTKVNATTNKIHLSGVKGPMDGTLLRFEDKEHVIIGLKDRNCPKEVGLTGADIAMYHAKIFKSSGNWLIDDYGSEAGTWLRLANYFEWIKGSVSRPRKLAVGDEIAARSYHFEVTSA